MACDVAAAEIRGIGSVPEDSGSAVPTAVVTVVQPCMPDEHRNIRSFTEQSAADELPTMGTAPEFCALDALVKELASKDTNSDQLELNNNNQQHDSGNDSMTDQQEQTSHGI